MSIGDGGECGVAWFITHTLPHHIPFHTTPHGSWSLAGPSPTVGCHDVQYWGVPVWCTELTADSSSSNNSKHSDSLSEAVRRGRRTVSTYGGWQIERRGGQTHLDGLSQDGHFAIQVVVLSGQVLQLTLHLHTQPAGLLVPQLLLQLPHQHGLFLEKERKWLFSASFIQSRLWVYGKSGHINVCQSCLWSETKKDGNEFSGL